jgi:hypothetical protein
MASNRQKEKEEIEKLKETLPTEAQKKEIEKLANEKNREVRETIDSTQDETKRSVNKFRNIQKRLKNTKKKLFKPQKISQIVFWNHKKKSSIRLNTIGHRILKICRIHTGHFGHQKGPQKTIQEQLAISPIVH